MLTACVLGLLSSPCFVGCGAQFRFGPLLISNLLAEFPCFGTVDCCYHSLCVVAAGVPWFWGCSRVVLAMVGPRTIMCFLVGLSCAHRFAASQGCEGLFCYWYAVVGIWIVLAWPIC